MKWRVIRDHEGDRPYTVGETREGSAAELGHLEGNVLERMDAGTDAQEKPATNADPQKSEGAAARNKAEGPSPANKADRQTGSVTAAKTTTRSTRK